jgi:hypothetical protein
MTARRRLTAAHPIEQVGAQLRAMMPWIAKNKLVDQYKNYAISELGKQKAGSDPGFFYLFCLFRLA